MERPVIDDWKLLSIFKFISFDGRGFDSHYDRENTHPNFFSPEPNIVEFTRSTKSHRLVPAQLNSMSFSKTARKIVSSEGEIRWLIRKRTFALCWPFVIPKDCDSFYSWTARSDLENSKLSSVRHSNPEWEHTICVIWDLKHLQVESHSRWSEN